VDSSISIERLLAEPDVHRLTTLSRSTRWRQVREGKFPAPVKITERRIAWRERDIVAWLTAAPATSEVA
jgi:prophage regulatory protein